MIAMTASIRSEQPRTDLSGLGQNLRRNFEHVLLHTNEMMVLIPGAGPVLVSENPGAFRMNIVAESPDQVRIRTITVDRAIRRYSPGVALLQTGWEKMGSIPVPFR
ncbi:hypothetical protein [Subtercola sp. RTI3]|uniref:hypothetical protein n=1 Tax=Subtercola sp. RTI3 TaxID=3048639 RepID=UPI002B235B9F|nr:hypothetical protein [Subtercola sp. RTI3]MEA9986794.1 hypothetical protein [Subtercola sp. RTI3]